MHEWSLDCIHLFSVCNDRTPTWHRKKRHGWLVPNKCYDFVKDHRSCCTREEQLPLKSNHFGLEPKVFTKAELNDLDCSYSCNVSCISGSTCWELQPYSRFEEQITITMLIHNLLVHNIGNQLLLHVPILLRSQFLILIIIETCKRILIRTQEKERQKYKLFPHLLSHNKGKSLLPDTFCDNKLIFPRHCVSKSFIKILGCIATSD